MQVAGESHQTNVGCSFPINLYIFPIAASALMRSAGSVQVPIRIHSANHLSCAICCSGVSFSILIISSPPNGFVRVDQVNSTLWYSHVLNYCAEHVSEWEAHLSSLFPHLMHSSTIRSAG